MPSPWTRTALFGAVAVATVICSWGEMRSFATSAFRMGETYGSTRRGHALIRRPSRCALSARSMPLSASLLGLDFHAK